jgi:hypothetical protein
MSLFHDAFYYVLIAIIGLYFLVAVFFSLKLSLRNNPRYFPFLLAVFSVLHCSYGLGSLWGVIKKTLFFPGKTTAIK